MNVNLSNSQIADLYNCICQIAKSKEIKQDLPNSGQVIYAVSKTKTSIEKILEEIIRKETGIRSAVTEAIIANESASLTPADLKKENRLVMTKMESDLKELFSSKQDVEVHQISEEAVFIIQKHLDSEKSTFILFEAMLLQEKPKE